MAVRPMLQFTNNVLDKGNKFTEPWRLWLINLARQIPVSLSLTPIITPSGQTGAQTILTSCGSVQFAPGMTSLIVSNPNVSTSSCVICTVGSVDSTMKSASVITGTGSFTMYPNASPTGETKVFFLVL